MIFLVVVGLLAGVITSLSPCVLPVLPVILAASVPGRPRSGQPQADARASRRRPYAVVAGLVLSFSLSTLFGSLLLGALGLPQDLLRDAGIVVLLVIGLGLIWPWFGERLERPFARLPGRAVNPDGNGLVLGLGLGLLFVPCAGPVLAAIAVIGASHRFSVDGLVLTAAFGIGAGLPLLVLAVAGGALTRRTAVLRRHARQLRIGGGVALILVAVAIGFNLTDGLQRLVPGYTDALQNAVAGSPAASSRLRALASGTPQTPTQNPTQTPAQAPTTGDDSCAAGASSPVNCGPAPELTGITGWLNTPTGPLSIAGLRGKVVLIDFWTYSCINCQRTLPHLEAWDRAYRDAGLVIIGVHTPEFAFEHVPANIAAQSAALGVRYPIAIDNDYATWNAYHNQYWPAEYLVDAAGTIRHVSFGEGNYGETEELIRQLLADRNPDRPLPPSTEVADGTPTTAQTAETYLGYHYAPLHVSGNAPEPDRAGDYRFPADLDPDTFALAGSWTAGDEALTAGPGAQLELNYQASRVYLVLGGRGSVTVRINGEPATTISVSGPPALYKLA
ncbi:MAG TPA: cytochrome c biogenesis protein DipZ, partial [Pseudonocardia sp.]